LDAAFRQQAVVVAAGNIVWVAANEAATRRPLFAKSLSYFNIVFALPDHFSHRKKMDSIYILPFSGS
jgi:hypothetical protein